MANELHDLTPPFPDQLRAFIAAKKLTQSAFQKRYSISETSLKRLLNGKLDRTRASTLAKIAKLMKDKKWPTAVTTGALPAPTASNPEAVVEARPVPRPVREVVDFRQFVSEAPYIQRNLLLFVARFPNQMPLDERDAWKTLIQQNVIEFTGLVTGHYITYDDGLKRYVHTPPAMYPEMLVKERTGKPVRNLLSSFYQNYVQGRTRDAIQDDGLCILALEPDLTGTQVVEAWSISGVVFSHTGCLPAQRDLTAGPSDAPLMRLHLDGKISVNDAVFRQAVTLLAELNASALS